VGETDLKRRLIVSRTPSRGLWFTFNNERTALGFAPQSVNIENVRANSLDRNFEKSVPLRGFKENAFPLRQAVADTATTDFGSGGLTTAQAFDIIFPWSRHGVISLPRSGGARGMTGRKVPSGETS
jgi:hypothetical protein